MKTLIAILVNVFTLTFLRGHKAQLWWAVRYGRATTLTRIVSAYPKLTNAQDNKGMTPVHHAVLTGNHLLLSLMLTPVTNVDIPERSGYTPLHIAAVCGASECARLLVTEGKANVNARTNLGATPLHLALEEFKSNVADSDQMPSELIGNPFIDRPNPIELVRDLLSAGADTSLSDKNGRTAMDIAQALNDPSLVQLLIRKGRPQ